MMAKAMFLCEGLRSIRTGQGKKIKRKVATELTSFIGQHFDRFSYEGNPFQGESAREAIAWGHHSKRKKGKGTFRRKGCWKGNLHIQVLPLSNTSQFLGQKVLKGSSDLRSLRSGAYLTHGQQLLSVFSWAMQNIAKNLFLFSYVSNN